MVVNKMNRKALRHEVYDNLLDCILTGTIPADSRIDENDLANKFGISRTPLREAISRLIQEGLVTELPYKGCFVKNFTPDEVKDIYDVRMVLEAKSVRLAVKNMTDENITELSEIVEQIKIEQQKGDILSFSKLDDQFHMYLADCSGNETLVKLITQLEKQIQLVKVMGNRNNEVANQAGSDRYQIMEAIADRNAELAAFYMEQHIENACKGVIATMNKLT
jgi:DNA-binding GntR family transcriptional regulator